MENGIQTDATLSSTQETRQINASPPARAPATVSTGTPLTGPRHIFPPAPVPAPAPAPADDTSQFAKEFPDTVDGVFLVDSLVKKGYIYCKYRPAMSTLVQRMGLPEVGAAEEETIVLEARSKA